jgi:GAF domain-containing protein
MSRKPAKKQHASTTKPKRNNAPMAASPASSTLADLQRQVSALTRELVEAREQQTATSEVLNIISSSPGELSPVFNSILENAARICEAKFGNVFIYERNKFQLVAQHNPPPAYVEWVRAGRWSWDQVNPRTPLTRIAKNKEIVHVADLRDEPACAEGDSRIAALVELAGARTFLGAPMLNDKTLAGAITVYRQEVRPFTDKQIELVKNFAAQAVIAIENTRLLNELRESLQQQTATSEVLGIISSSQGDLQPVFEAMLANATRLCDARFGNLALFDGREMRIVSLHNAPPALAELRQRNPVIDLERSFIGLVVKTKKLVHISDLAGEEPYASTPLAKAGGARTALGVPMLRDDELIGAISIYRQEVRPFTDKQIDLVTNFAAQAVIAIENTRPLPPPWLHRPSAPSGRRPWSRGPAWHRRTWRPAVSAARRSQGRSAEAWRPELRRMIWSQPFLRLLP